MPKIREILRIKLLVALGILLAFTTIQTARAQLLDWLNPYNWINALLQPVVFTTLAVPVFGNNLTDAFSLIGIQNSANYGYLDRYFIYLGSSTKDYYYSTLASIGIGLAGLAIIIGVISLLFEGLGFLREGEAYTVIKWALISPILIYIFPNVWNALAILTAVINNQIIDLSALGEPFISAAAQSLLAALTIAAPTGIGLIIVGAAFIAMMIFYLITMLIFGAVRITMLVAFVLLTPIFIPLMKTPRFGGIFQKFTTYAIEMLVATIVASMLMRTIIILFNNPPPTGNTALLKFGLFFALMFTPFISLFVTNWVLGTAAGVVAMAGEHALEQSSALLGGLAGARLGGVGGIAASLGGAAGGGAIGAVASGGKASRIIADVPAGSVFSKAGASILANKAILPAGAGLAGAIAVGLGKGIESLYLGNKNRQIDQIIKDEGGIPIGNKETRYYSPQFINELNSLSEASKNQMYEIIGAQAAGWDYGTLNEKQKDGARRIGRAIVEMNRDIMNTYGSAFLQKLHEKAIYPGSSPRLQFAKKFIKLLPSTDKDPLRAGWLRNAPVEYIGLYKLEKIADEYLNERNPERREELMTEFKRAFKESGARSFINTKSVEEYNKGKNKEEQLSWTGDDLDKLDKNDIKTTLALLRNDPNLAQYRVFKSRMDTALNIAERRRHLTGGAEEWLRKAERNYLNEQMHPTELKILEAVKANDPELKPYQGLFMTDKGKYEKIMNHPEDVHNAPATDFAKTFALAGGLYKRSHMSINKIEPKSTNEELVDVVYDKYSEVLDRKFKDFINRIDTNERIELNDNFDKAIAEHLKSVELAYHPKDAQGNEIENVIMIAPEEKDLAKNEVESIKNALKHDLDLARDQEKLNIHGYIRDIKHK
jgi:hypothetical protein